jgi:hypothetical protein
MLRVLPKLALLALCAIVVSLNLTVSTSAQSATPTPAPLFIIPTATSLPTATLSSSQIVKSLGGYGLKSSDLPGFTPSENNGTFLLEELRGLLSKLYPQRSEQISALITSYQAYGVIGAEVAHYFSLPCERQAIFGLGTTIYGLAAENAQRLATDSSLLSLYARLYDWKRAVSSGLKGRVFTAPVGTDLCSVPSKQHILEFAVGRWLVFASVYAPDTTDMSLVTTTLNNLANVVTQRIQPAEIIAAAPTATATPRPTSTPQAVGLSPLANPNDPSKLGPGWEFSGNKPGEDSYSLVGNNAILLITATESSARVCHAQRGDFDFVVKVTLGNHLDYQGAYIFVKDTTSPALFRLGVSDTDRCCDYDMHINSIGKSNTDKWTEWVVWDMDRRRAYSKTWHLKIRRFARNIFNAYYSADGTRWTLLRGDTVVVMPDRVEVCLAVYSDRRAEGFVATFEDVSVKPIK